MSSEYLTAPEVAEIMRCTSAKVRTLIEQGKLAAVNTSTATRPRWTIRRVDLEAFLTPACVARSEAKRQATLRRQRIDRDVPKVFG
jgi:excisionase family DNA binding protein